MKRLLILLLASAFGCVATAQPKSPSVSAYSGQSHVPAVADWKEWAQRSEIAPQFEARQRPANGPTYELGITARRASDFGAWRTALRDLRPGQLYRFEAAFRTEGVENPRRSVIARLEWLDAAGKPVRFSVRPPEYPIDGETKGNWTRMTSVVSAPANAAALDIQLALGFTASGSVTWKDIALIEISQPAERIVRAMTVHNRPRTSPSREANVATYSKIIRDAAPAQKPDIICLPEGMTVVGTGKSYVDVSEPVPGPTTQALGALARELRAYVVAGLYEREAPAVYNTAVLLDRDGKLVGKYRKTHLPREEWEAGLMPGDTYPIFQTDFGKLGILIC